MNGRIIVNHFLYLKLKFNLNKMFNINCLTGIPMFTIQQRYKYYFLCCIILYMCVFILVRIYPSAFFFYFVCVRFLPYALLSKCAFFSCAYIYICAFFRCAFFLCVFPVHFFPVTLIINIIALYLEDVQKALQAISLQTNDPRLLFLS